MRNQSGFTIIEMMVAIVIIAIVSALTVPSLIAWRNNALLSQGARQVYSDLQEARTSAIKLNETVAVDFGTDTYTFFRDIGNTPGELDGNDAPLIPSTTGDAWANSRKKMPPGVVITSAAFTASGHVASFNNLGFGRDFFNADNSGTVIVSLNGDKTRTIRVSTGGTIEVE